MGDTRRKATRLSHPKCAPRRRGSPANAALPPAWQSSAAPPRLSAVASPAFAAAHRLLLPCLRSPETLPAPLAPPHCPHLTARLLARLRPLPSRLVGTPPTPLRLGGAVAISDDGAHASLKFSAASPCGCCDDSSSDDDEHNTSNSLLLLCAYALIAPVLLSGLSEANELGFALGCRFALDVFTIQQDYPCCRSGFYADRPLAGGIGFSISGRSLQHGWTCTSFGLFTSSARPS